MGNSLSAAGIGTARKATLRRLLKRAIEEGHIWPAFQPIVDIRSGKIRSFEILARWSDPAAGAIAPMDFVPRLERHGLVGLLSDALLDRACREAAEWPGQFSLAFNISPTQLADDDFAQRLADIVAGTGFPLDRVELEVTEATLAANEDQAFKALGAVRDLGMRIGIDDYGTGYSNLARLESFHFDKLKIDARFIRNLHTAMGKRRIVASIVGLGQSLGVTVVAEGVETVEEERILREFGCDLGQGWLYARAEPAAEARRILARRGCAAAAGPPLDASPFQQIHQLATLYDKLPVGLCFVDLNGRFVRSNAQFASAHGMTPAEIEGRSIGDVVEGEALLAATTVLTQAASTDELVTMHHLFQGREFRIICARVADPAGGIIGFSVVALDVTEENRLKETLLASERHLRRELDFADAIINSLPGVFYYYDADSRLRRWNRNYAELTGYSLDELRVKQPLQCFAEDDKSRVAEMVGRILAEGHGQFEADFTNREGARTPYLFTGVRLDEAAGGGFVGVGIDVSAQRRAREALRQRSALLETLLNASQAGVLALDAQGKKLACNRRLVEIFQMPEAVAADPDGRATLDFIAGRLAEPDRFTAEIGRPAIRADFTRDAVVRMADGAELGCSVQPIRDEDGRRHGHIWSFRPTAG